MAMTYQTLAGAKTVPGSIRSWINWELVDVEGVMLDAQAFIYTQLRVRQMEALETIALSAGASSAPLPDRFLDPVEMRDITHGGAEIENVHITDLEAVRYWDNGVLSEGVPCRYSVYGEDLQFDVRADRATSARLLYYRQPAYLSVAAPTNFLTEKFPHLLRAALLVYAAKNFKSQSIYEREVRELILSIAAVNTQDDMRLRGARMAIRGA